MNKILATVLLCSATLAATASAADFATSAPTTPFYAGVQVGDATSVLGGVQIDKMFSAELMYSKYNEYATSLGIFGVANFPLALKGGVPLSVFAKVGVVRTNVDLPYYNCYYYGDCTSNSTDLAFGGGAQYEINKRFSARAGINFGKYKNSDVYVGGIIRF
jgi:hypothetical protein